nr:MAG TPA: Fibronectin type 3 domain-containing protein [Caudoviricetes sp.]
MKKIISAVMSILVTITSFSFAFALPRLERPVIDDIWHEKNNITLTWNGIDYAEEYEIYRSTSKNGDFEYYVSCEDEFYSDYDVKSGVRYYYKVKAVSEDYKSSYLSKWRSQKIPKKNTIKKASTSINGTTNYVGQTVYITDTGSKYHSYGCQYLRYSCYSISKSKAKAQGYTACSRCW